jgi:DNA-binding MarR family transcriptional regulator
MAGDPEPLGASAAIIRMSTAVGERVLEVRAASGLSARALQVIRLAARGVRINALAERLGAPKSTMTSVLDQLEDAGLAIRTIDPDDHRGQVVTSTAGGMIALRNFDRAVESALADLVARLDETKSRRLRELLAKLPDSTQPVPLAGPR